MRRRHIAKIIYTVLLLILPVAAANGQTYLLSGYVSDGATSERLKGAIVTDRQSHTVVVTGQDGGFNMRLEPGLHVITVTYVGYAPAKLEVMITDSDVQVHFGLDRNAELKEVVISSRAPNINVINTSMGVDRLTVGEIKRIPALMGEVDLLKAIQLLPGVQATSEGSSGFSVRGGSPDQNLILLDNTTIYNPSHLMGFFSVFNNDVVSELELYKGDLPLRYGGRLASVLDVRTKNERPDRIGGSGGIGLISSRLTLEGPAGERTSWFAGARRSYADLFLVFSNDESVRKTKMYFYDLNGKVIHRVSERDMVEISGYYGRDKYGAEGAMFAYGNAAAAVSWRHMFDDNILGKFTANFSNYDYRLWSGINTLGADWRSSILETTLRANFEHRMGNLWNLEYGFTASYRKFDPARVKVQTGEKDDTGEVPWQYFDSPVNHTVEYGPYISNEQKLNDRLTLRYGVRFSVYQNIGPATVFHYDDDFDPADSTVYPRARIYNTYTALEPRAGLVYLLDDNSSLKLNYARNTQFIQLANNSASGSPLDVWFSASPNIKPQLSHMVSAGYFRNFADNNWESSVEVYYKSLSNVIDFKDDANLLRLDGRLDGEVRSGVGEAYGVEFMVKRNRGTLNGFANYTLARSVRTIAGINDGETYLSPYDRTHTLNLVLNWEISRRLTASALWIYASGTPHTPPIGKFWINDVEYRIFSKRNEYRLPDYHRMDVSLTFVPRPDSGRRFRGEWNLSVYNVYNKKNPWLIDYKQGANGIPYAEMTYLFGIVPSLTYNFTF